MYLYIATTTPDPAGWDLRHNSVMNLKLNDSIMRFELTSLVEDLCKEYTAILANSKAVFRNAISVPVKSIKSSNLQYIPFIKIEN